MRRLTWLAAVASLSACGGNPPENSTIAVPPTETCNGAASACLSGTVQTDQFSASVISFQASLYRVFPVGATPGGAAPAAQAVQTVGRDGTWAFSELDAWGHYYVQIVPAFTTRPQRTVTARVGPLVVPNSSGPINVVVKPAQLDVLEAAAVGAPMQVRRATAHVFKPSSGDEVTDVGATASILVGGSSTQMTWVKFSNLSAYLADFAPPPAAQAAYTMTTTVAGSAPVMWTLASDPPNISLTLTTPKDGATIRASQDLLVSWPLQQAADYETVQVFIKQQSSACSVTPIPANCWSQTYASSLPRAADVNQETVPGSTISMPGQYLINVAFVKTNCPSSADGCVASSVVAGPVITAM